ncbi:DUF2007 domain-containing protein [Candidatus Fermentibacteria bacterium]|nr:DUF2007 domain-containing protein [Candidatus Fermentibacteria bacterium]
MVRDDDEDILPEEKTPDLSSEDLVEVFDASSEMEALAIQSLLEAEGLEAAIRNLQMPWYDGLAKTLNPVWGKVLVRESQEREARRLIEDYMYALEHPPECPDPLQGDLWDDVEEDQ